MSGGLVVVVAIMIAAVQAQPNCFSPGVNPAPLYVCDQNKYNEAECEAQTTVFADIDCDCGCGEIDPDCYLPRRFLPVDNDDPYARRMLCSGFAPQPVEIDPRYYQCRQDDASCFLVPLEWTCEPQWYDQVGSGSLIGGEAACHCGCGLYDPDCDQVRDGDIASVSVFAEYINGTYNGWVDNVNQHDTGAICNAEGNLHYGPFRQPLPDTTALWSCPNSWYNEVESGFSHADNNAPSCDCGCGAPDPDCIFEHERFFDPNSINLYCRRGAQQGFKWNDNPRSFCNAKSDVCQLLTEVPDWICPARWYGEKRHESYGTNGIPDCNCGCGALDSDCVAQTTRQTGEMGLLCSADGREDNKGFEDASLTYYCHRVTNECVQTPTNWNLICPPHFYDEGAQNIETVCDCNCGEWDTDCNNLTASLYCSDEPSNLERTWCSPKTLSCRQAPEGWFGHPMYYNEWEYGVPPAQNGSDSNARQALPTRQNPTCDCDQGIWDPDCDYQALDGVDTTCGANQFCSKRTNTCETLVVPGWTCHLSLYNELDTDTFGTNGLPDCDCGCGVYDPDCVRQDRRFIQGTDSFGLVCHEISLENTFDRRTFCNFSSTTCHDAPAGWLGAPSWFDELSSRSWGNRNEPSCNCGLGIWDPDCRLIEHELRCGVEASRTRQVACDPELPLCNSAVRMTVSLVALVLSLAFALLY